MKRTAKQSGTGGRLRGGLLMATVAALLLIPAASAFADVPAKVAGAGEGSGWVKGVEQSGKPTGGEPLLECHWNGALGEFDEGATTASGECETTAKEVSSITGITLKHEADEPGSEFGGWKILEGTKLIASSCTEEDPNANNCAVVSFGQPYIEVEATFNPEPPYYPFTVSPNPGNGEGSVECAVNGGSFGPCASEYQEGDEVEVTATPNTGSELTALSGTGSATGCSASPCSFTMEEESSVTAEFSLESVSLSVTESGEGTVECEVSSTPAPCNGTYTYGDTIGVSATPDAENVVGEMTGSGSASGECSIASEGVSGSCSFELTETSSVDVVFESAGTKATSEGNVHGEVPVTTSLVSACSDVDLGEFLPGVNANYTNNCGITATSTGAVTTLTASDESAVHTGHLVQGSYFLPSALETKVGAETYEGLETPVLLTTYNTPVSNQNETVWFRQHIGATDGLHTGPYAKTITLTLEQTTP